MKDLIKREDAIGAIEGTDWYHQNRNKDMVSGANSDEHQAWYKAEDVYKALEEVPSAEITHDDVMQYCKSRLLVLATVESIKHQYRIGFEDGKASADRPNGEWIEQEDDYHHYWECSECGMGVGLDDIRNFCPNCGARMKDVTEGLESKTDLIWYGDKTDLIGDETGRHTGWFGKGADDEDN